MSRQINQPINQVRLTNVAVVRINEGGKRFEIACYRNKVVDYRKGLETDLDEVLQTDRIFTNVSKGQFAKHSDLQKIFNTKNEETIARIILEKGQLQVSDLERQSQLENTLAQIATWVANHCVHPDSERPYTVSQIKHALGKQYQVQPHKPIKKQYLDCVKFLKKVIPIERAKMELALAYLSDREDVVHKELHDLKVTITDKKRISNENTSQDVTKCVILADPGLYRSLDDLAKSISGGKLEVLRQVVTQEGDVDLEMEIERKEQLRQSGNDEDEDKDEEEDKDEDDQGGRGNNDEDASSDGGDALAGQLKQRATIASSQGHDFSSSSSSEDGLPLPTSRKQQKQKQKQSKKTKRREREERAEKEAQKEAQQERQEERLRVEEKIQPVVDANAAAAGGNAKPCNTCGGSFPNAAAYRAHFKSDWHRFNQKLKLQGMPTVSEAEFKLCDEEAFFDS